MKKYFLPMVLLLCLILFSGCDPVLPKTNIKAICNPNPLTQDSVGEIEIIYPDTDGTAVTSWTDPVIEILSGGDVVNISESKLIGKNPGIAMLKISIKANCTYYGLIIDQTEFSTELKVEVVTSDKSSLVQ